MAFPSTLSSFNRPNPTDRLNSPSHSALHNTVSSAVGQLEAVVGVDGSNSVLGTVIGDLRSPGSGGGGHVQTANKGGTGQTTFTKGDILVASSASVLTKLSIPVTQKYALIVDNTQPTGLNWGLPGNTPTVRVYASTLTMWSKPSTLSYVVVEVVGGGGTGSNGSANVGGSGGGGGGYAKKIIQASSLASAVSVFAGGPATISFFGSIVQGLPGGNGGNRTGGSGGVGSVITLGSSTGEISTSGQDGGTGGGITGTDPGGMGGNSFYGGGGKGGSDLAGSSSGGNYGGGGGGGGSSGNTGGAFGSQGIVIVTEY